MLTVLITAQDEAAKLPQALASVEALGERLSVVTLVVDGGSHDESVAISEAHGAEVWSHPYVNSAAQKNWALERLTGWTLILDADEILSAALIDELAALDFSLDLAYSLPRRNYVYNREVRHGGWWPDYNVRLFRAEGGRYEDLAVHAHVITTVPVVRLRGPLLHHTYANVDEMLAKVSRHARRDAMARSGRSELASNVDRGSWLESKLKAVFWRLPVGRGMIRFIYMFGMRRGFLDGRIGFHVATMSALYEHLIDWHQAQELTEDEVLE